MTVSQNFILQTKIASTQGHVGTRADLFAELSEPFTIRVSHEKTMKIAYASDIHLEFNPPVTDSDLTGVDVVVIVGDLGVIPEHYAGFLRGLRTHYDGYVIFIMGNHEYYHNVFPDVIHEYRDTVAHDPRAFVLENESVIIDGVRFLGATLWTNFSNQKQMDACQFMMSDFQIVFDKDLETLTPQTILDVHKESLNWLDDQILHHPHDGPTVVLTHHAPSFMSQHPRFAGSPISGGFCSNLEAYIQRWDDLDSCPSIWVHGHVHDGMDYYVRKTHVLCNPWGYPDEMQPRDYKTINI